MSGNMNFREKSFDFAADVSKQLITLSTAIITVTITFSKDILGGVTDTNKYWLLAAWGMFVVTIFFGVWTLMALTGSLEPIEGNDTDNPSINSKNIRIPACLQVFFFIVALILTIVYGFKSITVSVDKNDTIESNVYKQEELRVIRKSTYAIEPEEIIDTLLLK